MKEVLIKGLFIKPIIKEILEKGSPEQIKELEEKIGKLDFSSILNYPIRIQVEAEIILSKILYGKFDAEEAYKLGKDYFDFYLETKFGKTMSTLFRKNPDSILTNLQGIYGMIYTNLDVDIKKLGDKEYSVRIYNDPYPVRGMEGLLAGGLEYALSSSAIRFIRHGDQDHEFIISWK